MLQARGVAQPLFEIVSGVLRFQTASGLWGAPTDFQFFKRLEWTTRRSGLWEQEAGNRHDAWCARADANQMGPFGMMPLMAAAHLGDAALVS